jgi:ribonucleotide reductase alpha subunit
VVDDVFRLAWRLGLKAISVYRDGSLDAQPESLAGARG